MGRESPSFSSYLAKAKTKKTMIHNKNTPPSSATKAKIKLTNEFLFYLICIPAVNIKNKKRRPKQASFNLQYHI